MTDSREDVYIKRERRRNGRPSHCTAPVGVGMCAAWVAPSSATPGRCAEHQALEDGAA